MGSPASSRNGACALSGIATGAGVRKIPDNASGVSGMTSNITATVSRAQLGRSMAAGATMGFATILVPGGNDTLLLSALPSLAMHGAVAYLAMLSAKRRKDRQLRYHK